MKRLVLKGIKTRTDNKRFVLLQDKDGNDILAEDLRKSSHIDSSGTFGDGNEVWWILIAIIILSENYFILKDFFHINGITKPSLIWMSLFTISLTYFLGVLYYFIPLLSYFVILCSVGFSYFSISDYIPSIGNTTLTLIVKISVPLLIGAITLFGNKVISICGYPYQLLIHEIRNDFDYQNTREAYPVRTIINLMRYKKMKYRFKRRDHEKLDKLADRIRTMGFNRGVELSYLSESSSDLNEKNRKKRLAREMEEKLVKLKNRYGNIHENYESSWRPPEHEIVYYNFIFGNTYGKTDNILRPRANKYVFAIYNGRHAYFGVVNSLSLQKPKIFLGNNLDEVMRSTFKCYEELSETPIVLSRFQ